MKSFAALTGILYEKGRQGFLTDLDTLYDTRLACVEEVSIDLALNEIEKGWSTRLYDRVAQIPKDKYEELYANRDVSTLLLANPTMASDAIKGWCAQIHNAMNGTPHKGFIEVFINVWPFKLSKKQAGEFAIKLNETLDGSARITMLNIDPKCITAYDAKLYFSCIMMQDWMVWIEELAQRGELKKAPIPDVTVYAPRILRGEISGGEYEQIRDKDIFTTIEDRLKPIVGLEFIETAFFSSALTPEISKLLRLQLKEKMTTTA